MSAVLVGVGGIYLWLDVRRIDAVRPVARPAPAPIARARPEPSAPSEAPVARPVERAPMPPPRRLSAPTPPQVELPPPLPPPSLATVTTRTGLQYQDQRVGTGPEPRPGQQVIVHYTGWLDAAGGNGAQFDSSRDRGEPMALPFGRGRVIPGWDEGLATMRVGGLRTLIVPAALGYGDSGAGDKIPPGATLRFEIELIDIKDP